MTSIYYQNNSLFNDVTLSHPAVSAALVKRKQSGTFPVDIVHNALLKAGLPDKMLPKAPSVQTALKRAMQDACRGDGSREVKTAGRRVNCTYTIVNLDRDKLDLELGDGKGIADAEITGKIDFSGDNSFSLNFSPQNHPSEGFIRHRFDHHCGQFSNVYDIGVWIGQKLLPSLGAIPTGSGDYFLPKGKDLDSLIAVKNAFDSISTRANFVNFYLLPQVGSCEDVVDVITDCLLDEIERVSGNIYARLEQGGGDNTKGPGRRALETMTKEANSLFDVLDKFSNSLGTSFNDIKQQVDDVKAAIGLAETAL